MTGRERIMATLKGEPHDRVAFAPLIDGYYTSSLAEQGIEPMDEIETLRYIGADIFLRHCPGYHGVFSDDIVCTVEELPDGSRMETRRTPVGEITTILIKVGGTYFRKKHYVETVEDLAVVKYIADHTEYVIDYDAFRAVDERIGDDGIPTISLPLTPIQEMLQRDVGVENFVYMLYDYEEEVRDYMNSLHERNLRCFKTLANAPEDMKVFIAYEDTSTTVMGPDWFEEFCTNQINEYADIMHAGGKIYITHMCGKLTGMLDELPKLKVDGIDSVCPPTTGDLKACDALSNLPGKVIIGGLEPPGLQRMSVDEAREAARTVLEECKDYDRFILCTGDATSFGTPIENLKVIADLVKEI